MDDTTVHDFRPTHPPVDRQLSDLRSQADNAWAEYHALIDREDGYAVQDATWLRLQALEYDAEAKRRYLTLNAPDPCTCGDADAAGHGSGVACESCRRETAGSAIPFSNAAWYGVPLKVLKAIEDESGWKGGE